MKHKDLKIDFRYLIGNIACLSVDSVSGEPIHNDINNEEAIIIFNSLVGEKEDCKTVKKLLKENAELKSQLKGTTHCYDEEEHRQLKKQLEEMDRKLFFTKNELDMRQKSIDNKLNQQQEFIKYLKSINSFETIGNILNKYKEIIGVQDENNT